MSEGFEASSVESIPSKTLIGAFAHKYYTLTGRRAVYDRANKNELHKKIIEGDHDSKSVVWIGYRCPQFFLTPHIFLNYIFSIMPT